MLVLLYSLVDELKYTYLNKEKKMCEGPSTISGPIPPHPMFLGNLDNLEDLHTSRSTNTWCEGPSKLSGPIINHFDNNNKA